MFIYRYRQVFLGWVAVMVLFSLVGGSFGCTGAERRPQGDRDLGQEPTISLYIAETGEKKEIKLEEYIQGVVAAEMEPAWPINALAAQAILARTFTLERIKTTKCVAKGTRPPRMWKSFRYITPRKDQQPSLMR